jgi:hypothetical protein
MMFKTLKMKVKQMKRKTQIIIIKKIVMKNLYNKLIFSKNNWSLSSNIKR